MRTEKDVCQGGASSVLPEKFVLGLRFRMAKNGSSGVTITSISSLTILLPTKTE